MSQPGIAPFQRHLHHHRHADVVNDVEAETVQFFQDDLRLRRFKPCERFDLLAVSFKDQAQVALYWEMETAPNRIFFTA